MLRSPSRDSRPRVSRRAIVSVCSPEMSTGGVIMSQASVVSTNWFSANDPCAVPFRLSAGAIVDQLGICHGSSAGNNFDLGVYDSAFARLVSTGSTLAAGNNLWQFVNVTDTALEALKTYYLVGSRDNATANRTRAMGVTGSALGCNLAGVQDSATDAFPLPNPLTNMALAATVANLPLMAMAMRAPF